MSAPSSAGCILVVDDEESVRRLLQSVLARNNYEVLLAATGEEALECALEEKPDLVILDLSLPGVGGLEVCRRLRAWFPAPILILSGHGDSAQKVAALDLGADDYVTKPFVVAELLARLRALLRRVPEPAAGERVISIRELEIDTLRCRLLRNGEEIRLTRTEFNLLVYLARRADCVVTWKALNRDVLGQRWSEDNQTLRVHVGHLRRKVEPDPSAPRYILTERGLGYRLRAGQL